VQTELFNINCDEVYDIAYGRSKDDVARRGRVAVFCEYVSKVCSLVRSHGKRPMFWGDVVLTHDATPQHQAQLASLREHNPVALVWGYEPDTPFDTWLPRVHAAGLEAWVCPGTSCWRSIAGRATERRENVANAIAAGIKHGARGVLLCEWGDCGHWQTWPVTRHALRSASQQLWQESAADGPHNDSKMIARGAASASICTDPVGAWIDALADADIELRAVAGALSKPGVTRLRNQTALFASLARDQATIASVGHIDLWRRAQTRVHALAATMPDDPDVLSLSSLERDELSHTVNLLMFAADRAVAMLDGDSPALASLPSRIAALERDHRRLWLARSRSGGLESSCTHFASISC
jgi:hexosaminidase